jgi:putative zinc finger protein
VRNKGRELLTDKSCKQITDWVYDYLSDNLNRDLKRDFQQHLKICPDCVHFLNTYKKTVAVTGTVHAEEIPAKVKANILKFLQKKMRKSATRS